MFRVRGYTDTVVDRAAQMVANKTQKDCLQPRNRASAATQPIQCIVQYSPLGTEFKRIIKRHWHLLSSDPTLGKSFSIPPRLVYRRAPSIKDRVVHSDLPPIKPQTFMDTLPNGNRRCGRCTQCAYTSICDSFEHPRTKQQIQIRGRISCSTTNCIYLLWCVECKKYYVGKTRRTLKTRICEHRSAIRNNDERSPVAVHFKENQHPLSSLRYIGIEHVSLPRRGGNIDNLLLKRELWWCHFLGTLAPEGLNQEFDIRPYLI